MKIAFKKLAIIVMMVTFCLSLCSVTAFAEGDGKLNVNSATQEQLEAVPGMNEDLAQKIMDYRDEMGDIYELDELKEIDGFSPDLVDKLKAHLSIQAIEGSDCTC